MIGMEVKMGMVWGLHGVSIGCRWEWSGDGIEMGVEVGMEC